MKDVNYDPRKKLKVKNKQSERQEKSVAFRLLIPEIPS